MNDNSVPSARFSAIRCTPPLHYRDFVRREAIDLMGDGPVGPVNDKVGGSDAVDQYLVRRRSLAVDVAQRRSDTGLVRQQTSEGHNTVDATIIVLWEAFEREWGAYLAAGRLPRWAPRPHRGRAVHRNPNLASTRGIPRVGLFRQSHGKPTYACLGDGTPADLRTDDASALTANRARFHARRPPVLDQRTSNTRRTTRASSSTPNGLWITSMKPAAFNSSAMSFTA